MMLSLLGTVTAAGGLLLFLWYRTLAGFPGGRQPQFIHSPVFKWGFPVLSVAVFLAGVYLVGLTGPWRAVLLVLVCALLAGAVIRFDRHSAEMRLIFASYRQVREANPGMEEIEVLFRIAQQRYPEWGHDRVLELVAGKNIRDLMLLMLVRDNGIHPLKDWELYRSLRKTAARITGLAE